jgi:hypothetical protein
MKTFLSVLAVIAVLWLLINPQQLAKAARRLVGALQQGWNEP